MLEMRDTRTPVETKIDSLQRLLMWHTLSGMLPLYLVTEYPKSGGTWVGQMLAAYFDVPFPRNQRPRLLASCIMHGHYLYSPFFRNVFCVIRDGRDVMVSQYYHSLFHNDRNSPYKVEEMRRTLPFDDYKNIQKNLPRFIKYMFTEAARGPFQFSWNEFVGSWINKHVPIIRYEDLLLSASSVLGPAIQRVTGGEPDLEKLQRIEKEFSFENLTRRKAGSEDIGSFLRKGISGDWKNHFTSESAEIFDHYAGETLILLGYETDRLWIGKRPSHLSAQGQFM